MRQKGPIESDAYDFYHYLASPSHLPALLFYIYFSKSSSLSLLVPPALMCLSSAIQACADLPLQGPRGNNL